MVLRKVENRCIRHTEGDFRKWRTCAPIGKCIYYLKEKRLYDSNTFSEIEISTEEAGLLEQLVMTGTGFEALETESYNRLNEYLEITLE
jgi:hypothetical protein